MGVSLSPPKASARHVPLSRKPWLAVGLLNSASCVWVSLSGAQFDGRVCREEKPLRAGHLARSDGRVRREEKPLRAGHLARS